MKVAIFFEFTEVCIQLPCRGYVHSLSKKALKRSILTTGKYYLGFKDRMYGAK